VLADPSNDHLLRQRRTTGSEYRNPLGNLVSPQWRVDGLWSMSRVVGPVAQMTDAENASPSTTVERTCLFKGKRARDWLLRTHDAAASGSIGTTLPSGGLTMRSIRVANRRSASAFSRS
jgi:hypothetical protein